MKTNINNLEKSQIEVDFELTKEEFQKYIDKALLHLKEHVKVDGFRKGNVPKEMVEEKVGKENLLMEAGDLAVKDAYRKFIEEQKLEPIGEPEVQIKKIAKGSEFLFTVKVTVLSEIQLPDYKEIASHIKGKEISVDEKEILDTLDYLQKSRAKFITENSPAQNKDFVEIEYENKNINSGKAIKDRFILSEGGFMKDFEDNILGMRSGDQKEFKAKFPGNAPNNLDSKESNFKVKMVSVQKVELAEINDDFARGLGDFDSLVALKENLKKGIALEKKETERQGKRGEILEKISQKITFDIPEKMVDFEEQRLLEGLQSEIKNQFKITFEEYLASIKKTEDEIKKSFRMEAEKKIKNFLVLREIGKKENIEIRPAELDKEMNNAIKKYTKEQLAKIDIEQLREYTKGAIFNEKVFQKLEEFSKINK